MLCTFVFFFFVVVSIGTVSQVRGTYLNIEAGLVVMPLIASVYKYNIKIKSYKYCESLIHWSKFEQMLYAYHICYELLICSHFLKWKWNWNKIGSTKKKKKLICFLLLFCFFLPLNAPVNGWFGQKPQDTGRIETGRECQYICLCLCMYGTPGYIMFIVGPIDLSLYLVVAFKPDET